MNFESELRAVFAPVHIFLPRNSRMARAILGQHTAIDAPDPAEEGEWTRDLLHEVTKGDQGFTVHDALGDAPTAGYMVSIDPRNEESFPLIDAVYNPDWIGDYYDRHRTLLAEPDTYVGAWVYRNQLFLDVSRWVPDPVEAEFLALQFNQKAYYNLGTGQTIMVERSRDRELVYARTREALLRILEGKPGQDPGAPC